MGRETKKNKKNKNGVTDRVIVYSAIGLTVVGLMVFILFMYSKNLNSKMQEGMLGDSEIASLLNNSDDFESASSSIGKTVEESANNINSNTANSNATNNANQESKNVVQNASTVQKPATSNTTKTNNTNNVANVTKQTNANKTKEESKDTNNESKELKFEKPVEGEISKEFSKDSLVYSETLKEWVTHLGVDIKADKTTVVKAAEAGCVKTIKNDPRYGITVVIEHANGFQTVYANLLTTEFVVEGEKVEKGQSIGTVGNTAIFEIADESHLHFEILKDGAQVDPNLYLK